MKILRLDLLRFGPFTNESLVFEDEPCGLHIVYGPNEAGKSSALRAVKQLLYGIPHNSSDDFIHPHKDLRIGGLLQTVTGARLECIRRKGRNQTLRGADDVEPLDQARLVELLSHVDEETFNQRYGIDYLELVSGGRAIAQGGGDLGKALFTAGSGIADLGRVQQQLTDEADKLFKNRGSVQRINEAVSELHRARQAIKEAQLPSSEWEKHDTALRQAQQRMEEISQQLQDKTVEKSRLERIIQALPLIARRQRHRDELAGVADAPHLSPDFDGSRREAATELRNAQQAVQHATDAIQDLNSASAQLDLPQGLLEHRTAITLLHTDLGSFKKAVKDRPLLESQRRQAEAEASAILRDLGHTPDWNATDQLRLSRTQRQRIQSLAGECQALIARQDNAAEAVRKLREQIESAEQRLEAMTSIPDPRDLLRAIRRVQKQGDLDERLAAGQFELQQLEEQAEVDRQKLRLWTGSLSELELLAVPTNETIERFEQQLADSSETVRVAAARVEECEQKAQALDHKLARLRLERDVPTEADLARVRKQRDAGWQLVCRVWLSGAADDEATAAFIGEFAPGGNLAAAFQSCLETADQIADRLRREADRVAEKAQLTVDREDLKRATEELRTKLTAAREDLAQVQAAWCEQWQPLGIAPLTPREMRAWAGRHAALVAAAQAIRRQRSAVADTAALIRSQHAELATCLTDLGPHSDMQNQTLASFLGSCEELAERLEAATSERQELVADLEHLRQLLPDAEQQAKATRRAVDNWREGWATAIAGLGLAQDASPAEANTVLAAVDEFFAKRKDADDKRERVEGIDRENDEFKENVRRLTAQIAGDLATLPVDQAVSDLYDRLDVAVAAHAQLEELNKQLARETAKRNEAAARVKHWMAQIATLCQEAGCATPEELPEAERRSAKRQELESSLQALEEQLLVLAAGSAIDDFVTAASHHDPDQLRATQERLTAEINQLESEKTEVSESVGTERTHLKHMDGSGRAAEAQEQVEQLLAKLRGDAEQYVRLRLASTVLQRAIERFREKHQGPVLERASELFGELTLAAFSGLRADYNDQAEAVLVGVRPNGQTVGVEGMSDGTCDQLYLALRLASLEADLTGRPPLPFIVDDILIKFDDDRAGAALKAIARLSERTQVIFFTHHEHLLALATANLDGNKHFVHRLASRAIVAPAGRAAITIGP